MRSFFSLLVSFLFLGALVWLFFALYTHYKRVNLRFEKIYGQVESLIEERRYEEAYSQLLQLAKLAVDSTQWEMILKRAYNLSCSSGRYIVLSSLSEKACASCPSNELFWALRIYSSLRSGSCAVVYDWAKTYLKDPLYEPLVQEALLASLWADSGEEAFFSRLEKERDPLILEQIGDILCSTPFYYNASLLYLREGRNEDVKRIFGKISDKKSYTRSFAYLAYLAQDWDWVIESLTYLEEEDATLLLLLAEVYLLKRDYKNAEYVYQKIVNDYPGYRTTPYINLALIGLKEGQPSQVLEILKLGKEFFNEDAEFMRYYAMVLASLGRESHALVLLQPWIGKDDKIDLLAFSLANKDKSQSARTAKLWQMWRTRKQYDKDLAKLMLFEFSKANLWYDFDLLTRELPSLLDNDIYKFLAYKDFFFGEQESAQKKFFEGVDSSNQYEAFYNVALLYYQQKDFQKALEYLDQSYARVPFKELDQVKLSGRECNYLANLFYYRGKCQYYLGLKEEARFSLEKSVGFCPSSASMLVGFYNLFSPK